MWWRVSGCCWSGAHRVAAGNVAAVTTETAPPAAKRVPSERTHHGDTVVDEYAWLADKDDPETIAYLTAENAYTEARTAHLAALREEIFKEIKPTHPGDRPVGADPQGRVLVLHPHGRGQAVRHPVPAGGPRRRDRAADQRGRRAARRRGGAARRQRCWPRGTSSSRSARSTSAPTAAGWPTPPTSPATSGSRCASRTCHRRGAAGRGAGHVLRHGLVGRRLDAVLHDGGRRLAARTGSGGTPGHRRPPTTCWSTRSPTSGSGSASS